MSGTGATGITGFRLRSRLKRWPRREERLSAITNEYVKGPQPTLVVSPDNHSRQDLNDAICGAMIAQPVGATLLPVVPLTLTMFLLQDLLERLRKILF